MSDKPSYGLPGRPPEQMLAEMRAHRDLIERAIRDAIETGRTARDAAENVMGHLDLAGLTIVPKQTSH